MASNLIAIASNLRAMASNLINSNGLQPNSDGLQPVPACLGLIKDCLLIKAKIEVVVDVLAREASPEVLQTPIGSATACLAAMLTHVYHCV